MEDTASLQNEQHGWPVGGRKSWTRTKLLCMKSSAKGGARTVTSMAELYDETPSIFATFAAGPFFARAWDWAESGSPSILKVNRGMCCVFIKL